MSEYGSEDDDDFDLDFGQKSNPSAGTRKKPTADAFGFDDMQHYMEQMDRELSHTQMGKTFVTEVCKNNCRVLIYASVQSCACHFCGNAINQAPAVD